MFSSTLTGFFWHSVSKGFSVRGEKLNLTHLTRSTSRLHKATLCCVGCWRLAWSDCHADESTSEAINCSRSFPTVPPVGLEDASSCGTVLDLSVFPKEKSMTELFKCIKRSLSPPRLGSKHRQTHRRTIMTWEFDYIVHKVKTLWNGNLPLVPPPPPPLSAVPHTTFWEVEPPEARCIRVCCDSLQK